jgi:aminopeptidase N
MENFGLITYIDNGLLLNPNEPFSSRTYQENSITGLIAHETAHQWFGYEFYLFK